MKPSEISEIGIEVCSSANDEFVMLDGSSPFEDFSEDGVFLGDRSDGKLLHEGAIIVTFANIRDDADITSRIERHIESSFDASGDVAAMLSLCFGLLEKDFGSICAKLIMMNGVNDFLNKKTRGAKKTKDAIVDGFRLLCLISHTYASTMANDNNGEVKKNGLTTRQILFSILDVSGSFLGMSGLGYRMVPGYLNDELAFIDVYRITNSMAAIYFDVAQLLKEKKMINLCKNCGKYFLPTSRSDEIYCDNIFKNGKTCKQLGYEIKVKNDEVLNAYRTIYKTQNARKQRNKHIADSGIRFSAWTDYAKIQLKRCQNGEISLEDFTANISGDDWLRKKR
ncbi:MAG: DUF6076 domain-containing protein [Firmicutes bacterium]|nr:DUF6076 domain-containing protein [Bacillota bacterium]